VEPTESPPCCGLVRSIAQTPVHGVTLARSDEAAMRPRNVPGALRNLRAATHPRLTRASHGGGDYTHGRSCNDEGHRGKRLGEDLSGRRPCGGPSQLRGRGGGDLRPGRSQRSGQVDDGEDPHDAVASRRGGATRRRAERARASRRREEHHWRGRPEVGLRPGGDGARECAPARPRLRPSRAGTRRPDRRALCAVRPRRRRRSAGAHLLGRHTAATRHRAGAGAPPASAVPGRTHHRARSRGCAPSCGARSRGWRATRA
jgi:hypothetical protein